jgi:hypothetical protein
MYIKWKCLFQLVLWWFLETFWHKYFIFIVDKSFWRNEHFFVKKPRFVSFAAHKKNYENTKLLDTHKKTLQTVSPSETNLLSRCKFRWPQGPSKKNVSAVGSAKFQRNFPFDWESRFLGQKLIDCKLWFLFLLVMTSPTVLFSILNTSLFPHTHFLYIRQHSLLLTLQTVLSSWSALKTGGHTVVLL